MELWQLVILFPTDNVKGLSIDERLRNFTNCLITDEVVNPITLRHPNIVNFLNKWKDYVSMPIESPTAYDDMKKMFIDHFGAKWFDSYLNLTYYFHQGTWLVKYNRTDSDCLTEEEQNN